MKYLFAITLLFATIIGVSAQVKTPLPSKPKVPFAESLQTVVVATSNWTSITGTARLFARKTTKSKWKANGDSFPVVVGRSGLGWSRDTAPESVTDFKKEGDGKAPAGMFPLTFAFGSGAKADAVTLPYKKLDETTNCVDDINSFHYNKVVGSLQVGIFDWKSSEKMLAVGAEYELGIFVAHNTYPVRKGDGSCIFLHIWKDATSPTSGCTAMERANLERILSWANPKSNPYLVQLPVDEYTKMTKAWNLPKL